MFGGTSAKALSLEKSRRQKRRMESIMRVRRVKLVLTPAVDRQLMQGSEE
jgi:hypothetical protein